ncbi:MAG TPA: hypothetical protein PLW65_21530 [Pseudomonadota bacterium]|nr:hypothetical protein [Pseudomonadota bacterium]
MFSCASASISRIFLLTAGALGLACGFPLGVGGCSRGDSAEVDAGTSDRDLAEARRDLATVDLQAPPDLASDTTCPAPCWLNPLPQGNNLRSLWREPSGDGWAVGFGPSVVQLEGGRARLVRTPVRENKYIFNGVWGSGPSDVWAVGNSIVLHYDGKTWSQSPIDTSGSLYLNAVWGSGPKDVWSVGLRGAIRRYDGTAWQVVPSGVTGNLTSVHGTSDKNIFAVGAGGTVLRYDGTAWRSPPFVTGSDLTRVRCAAATDCLAVGAFATVVHWNGTAWTVVKTTGMYGTISGLVEIGPSSYLLSGYSVGGPYAYRYDGKTFTEVATDGVELTDIAGPRADDLTAVGSSGSVAHWNGLSWTRLSMGSTEIMQAVWAASPTEVWISGSGSGNGGHLIRWDGKTFSQFDAPARTVYKAIWGSSASAIWAVGYEGGIARWDGSHWSAEPKATTANLHAIAGSGPTQVWASGEKGVLLRYDGTKWTAQPSLDASSAALGLWLASASDGWAVGTNGTKGLLWRFDGSSWTAWPKQFDQPFNVVWGSGPKDVWAGGDNGLLAHFDGTEWVQAASPSTAAIQAIRGSGPGNVWLAPYGGTAQRFDGSTWREVFTDTRQNLNGFWVDGSQVLAVGTAGTVLRLAP